MPITASAKKALRQSVRRRVRNLTRSNAYKTAIKELQKIVASATEPKKEAQKLLAKAYKSIDKAAKTGVIKKNKAGRLKSAAAKLLVIVKK
ncbi:MAG: 30S ribosomal protein S20 [Candidatus Yanofskybacteria bacterium RIFCSPHIGHO2_02_FULL_41_29]|uniref:Small ribosomal subunit protein bS20 n=1 Tax=Candidatus Yanofskybacteria bacterium RIFCSPHIGHO2_01_FULL_41_53 TaxID=1802663 RepID=A0A1F8EJT2_9BACT|nr:MAG: 30S ribosomal protein S20 [Candidatus Yanofskybacteria bacterium RIFCSPHIGHO2_01_FULL_41_53]OGN12271.1 MAG: 30S ribosomal protein S20 [Candidatus Yanofskybacteria bacterium RIFCSPHIGHO2_02_FULL_41_29]OGN18565.1 MAG: 30S ribosomal protein S20 [Candidatus Yanofskybacteria bacterium RIFCSPHIGHO2_12_FULL_41_9]OGN23630.1 MAG: 30S ribosomal protein S20 [Candidatus Yanofskybacteria bacterium RIFCSPLOWO2_01_FULL_41_67]OGN29383.1 MAG: 30S ribosomal protein S20 [Candidatus Yanofskybacteria bacter